MKNELAWWNIDELDPTLSFNEMNSSRQSVFFALGSEINKVFNSKTLAHHPYWFNGGPLSRIHLRLIYKIWWRIEI